MDISIEQKVEYYKRLCIPYKKRSANKFFIDQYLNGDGNELKSHFWSNNSSSRLAFELYSWLANEEKVLDFEFEFKLKGIKHSPKRPNMDVFIETNEEIIFIESKYTEMSEPNLNKLPQSYYLKNAKSTKNGDIKSELKARYYNDENACKYFTKFINLVDKHLNGNKNKRYGWLDYSQEIKHLIGIYLFLTDEKNKQYKDKKIRFYNIFYFDNKKHKDIEIDNYFFEEAEKMMKELIDNFDYKFYTIQDVINEIDNLSLEPNAFGLDKTVKENIKNRFPKLCFDVNDENYKTTPTFLEFLK